MEVKKTLNKIDALKLELDTYRPLDEIQEKRIFQKFRLDWNYHSSKIEGNALTYGETKGLLLFGITAQGKPLRDHFEITGHNEAIDYIVEVIREDRPITESFIRELHELLLKETHKIKSVNKSNQEVVRIIEIGKYKKTPNHVKTNTGEVFYFASPEETPAKMQHLMDWFKKELSENNTHPLVLAAEFHYRFITIHPFDDGNGRMARLLMNLTLMAKGFPPVIIKEKDKENYFAALRQADAGVLGGFVNYIGQNLIHSLDIMIKGAKGESIEDEDDIDKEIALFKKSLEGKGKITILTEEIFNDLIISSFKPLIEKTKSKLNKFNELFLTIKDEIQLRGYDTPSSHDLSKSFSDLSTALGYISIKRLKNLFFIRYFKYFNIRGKEAFTIHTTVGIGFKQVYFFIETKDFRIKKYYSEQLTEEEINNIANQAAKSVLEEIKQKMK